jgi:hypothetical protein
MSQNIQWLSFVCYGLYTVLVCADEVRSLKEDNKYCKEILVITKRVGLEVNAEETECICVSYDHSALRKKIL